MGKTYSEVQHLEEGMEILVSPKRNYSAIVEEVQTTDNGSQDTHTILTLVTGERFTVKPTFIVEVLS